MATRSRRNSPSKIQDSKKLARLASELVEVLSEWWPASPNFLIAAQSLRNALVEIDALVASAEPAPEPPSGGTASES